MQTSFTVLDGLFHSLSVYSRSPSAPTPDKERSPEVQARQDKRIQNILSRSAADLIFDDLLTTYKPMMGRRFSHSQTGLIVSTPKFTVRQATFLSSSGSSKLPLH
jgi:hypothetical protein